MRVVKTVEATLSEIIRNRGHVVVIASIQAFQNGVGVAPYAMSKAGIELQTNLDASQIPPGGRNLAR
jgi:short-subunit dehydrogenase